MKIDSAFINNLHGGDSVCVSVCVCVCVGGSMCADVRVPFQYVFMRFEKGRGISGELTLVDDARHHPQPPPPCATAIIKMIYLTIGPRLRD